MRLVYDLRDRWFFFDSSYESNKAVSETQQETILDDPAIDVF